MSSLETRDPSLSRTVLAILTNPAHANPFGVVHGGVILRIADECGAVAALRHAGAGIIATAGIDSLTFLAPVRVGERLEARAEVTYAGRTSIETRLEVRAEPTTLAEPRLIAVGYGVYVSLDDTGHPRPVPALPCETESDRGRLEAGRARQADRLRRRNELFPHRPYHG